jgi:hypothetical protein
LETRHQLKQVALGVDEGQPFVKRAFLVDSRDFEGGKILDHYKGPSKAAVLQVLVPVRELVLSPRMVLAPELDLVLALASNPGQLPRVQLGSASGVVLVLLQVRMSEQAEVLVFRHPPNRVRGECQEHPPARLDRLS